MHLIAASLVLPRLACHQALAINKLSAKNLNKPEVEAINIRELVMEQVITRISHKFRDRDLSKVYRVKV